MAPPRDPTGAAEADGVVDYLLAAQEAEDEEEAERAPERGETDDELAVPPGWRRMEEGSDEGGEDDDAFEDEEEVSGDEMMETDARQFVDKSFEFSEYFDKGRGRNDNVIESLANAQSLFSRRWYFPGGLVVTVAKIDNLEVAGDILDFMQKLEGEKWTINNVDRLKQAALLDQRLRDLHRELRRLWRSLKKQEAFEGANSLGDLLAQIDGLYSLQPASTWGTVSFITRSMVSLLAASAMASPLYDELMITAENLWCSVGIAREEAIVYQVTQ